MTSRRRRFAVAIAALVGLPLALAIVAIAALVAGAVFGASIDASRWRDMAAQQASMALGRPVKLQGAFELKLGRELGLRVGGVQIMNPPGFTEQAFLAVGEARARVDVFDVLRGRLRLRSVEAGDVGLWLERGADGRGNWTLARQGDPPRPQPEIDIDRMTLHGLGIHYHDARSGARRLVELDEVSGSTGPNALLRLVLRGRLDGFAYAVKVDGGPLRLLQGDAEPWPFTLEVNTTGARLHASGTLDTRLGAAQFRFGANADDPAPVERLVGARLPRFGAAALHGKVTVAAGAIELADLQVSLGESQLSGNLALAFGAARPRLSGALSAAAIDLRPLLAVNAHDADHPGPRGKPLDDDDPARRTLPLRDLAAFDVEVDLRVERWLGLPVDIRDARFAWRADARGVHVPMSAALARVPLSGSLDLDTAAPVPTLAFQLSANKVALADLARDLAQDPAAAAPGVEGTLGHVGLRVGGRGDTLGSLLRDLEFSLAVAAAQVSLDNIEGARPVTFTLDTLDLAVRRGEPVRGRARGSLLGERATLTLRAGTLSDMLRERAAPVEIDLALAQAALRVAGTFAHPEAARATALRFDFKARHAGDLAHWLGVAPESRLAVAARGRVRIADGGWALEQTTLELGRSELTVDARRSLSDGRPLIMAAVRSPLIDVQELSTLRAGATARASAGAGARTGIGARIDAPIFAAGIELADADIELDLKHLLLGRTDLVGVGFVGRTRDGRLLPSPVTGKVAGAPFTALIELDPRGELPMASLDLSTAAIDLGMLLRGLGVAEDIDGRADALRLKLQGRGNSLREFATHSDIEVRVSGGSITVRGAAQRPVAEIRVDQASIGATAGEPIRVRLDGALDRIPVKIEVTSGTFADFARDATRLPFALSAQAADSRLRLDGEVALPLGREAQLRFEMSGERLDTLSPLARVELPAWGPWSLRGPIRTTSSGYELRDLQIAVGQSRLSGRGTLDMSGPRPRLDVQVAAPRIQLDDFPLPQRLTDEPPLSGNDNSGGKDSTGDGMRGTASRLAGRTDRLLGAKFLRRFDATIDVQAREVLSGIDRLADGALHLQLEGGRLHLDPAVVNLPGGTMRLSISYDLKESVVEFALAAYVEQFDYGIIARRLGRANDLEGLFSLQLELEGTAPSLDAIMKNADGKLDFAVWPTELRSGMFNLWSANLVLTLLPLIDPGAKSQVNCIVGRFDLRDGDLSDDKIMIDTSTVRIRGEGHANLATEELGFVFRPRAKGLGLLRLQTPLRVTGTLTDQRFGFTQADVAESVLRLIASPVLLPIEWLTRGPMPRDGADVCTDPLRAIAR